MKCFFLFIFLSLWVSCSFCQSQYEQEKIENYKKLGYNVSIFRTQELRFSFSPNVILFSKNHAFFIGPKLLIDNVSEAFEYWESDRYIDSFIERVGLFGGYHFYPNAKSDKIEFYFEYIVQFASFKRGRYTGTFPDIIRINEGRDYILENTIGYGFKLKLTPKIYLNQSVGLGFQTSLQINKGGNKYLSNEENLYFIKLGIDYDL